MITSRCAIEDARDVLAIPGAWNNPWAQGCNWLIQQGAYCLWNTQSLEEYFHGLPQAQPKQRLPLLSEQKSAPVNKIPTHLEPFEKEVLELIGPDKVTLDCLLEGLKWPMPKLQAILCSLQLKALVESIPGGLFLRR